MSTKTTPPAIPISEKQSIVVDRSADAGLGFENFNPAKDQKKPFIQIVQKMSPELDKKSPKYISGAEDGDLFNTATRKLYKVSEPEGAPLKFVPVNHLRVHNEWIKRTAGGGFVISHRDGSEPANQPGFDGTKKVKELVDNTKHSLEETVMFHIIIVDDEDGTYEAVLSMKGGSLGAARDFTSKLKARKILGEAGRYTPPYMDNLCELKTVVKKSPEGDSTYNAYSAEIVGRTIGKLETLYIEAKEVHATSAKTLALMSSDAALLGTGEEEGEPSRKSAY